MPGDDVDIFSDPDGFAARRAAALARGQAAANGDTAPDDWSDPPSSTTAFAFGDLAALMRKGVMLPKLICGELLYAGGLHTLAGAPDAGKTFLTWWWALTVLRDGGTVVVFDEESGLEITADKLLALDADPDEISRLHYCEFPHRTWGDADLVALADVMTARRPDLVIWDSSAAFLAHAGLDEDHAPEVTRFWARVLSPCARTFGAAVLVIDHDTKAKGAMSRYARGSGAKLAMTDVAFKLSAIAPFSRTQPGKLTLTVTKDRRGVLHRDHTITVTPASADAPLTFAMTAATPIPVTGLPQMQAHFLDVLSSEPATRTDLINRVQMQHGRGYSPPRASNALNALLKAGLADKIMDGRTALWSLPRGADDGAPEQEEMGW